MIFPCTYVFFFSDLDNKRNGRWTLLRIRFPNRSGLLVVPDNLKQLDQIFRRKRTYVRKSILASLSSAVLQKIGDRQAVVTLTPRPPLENKRP